MAVTETIKKQVLTASGNQCYHPECDEFMFNLQDEVIMGEVAHIEGEKSNAPRFNEKQTQEERNSFSNLIALCPNHHTLIDKAPDKYPKEMLFQWKKEHEEKITYTLDKNWIQPPNSITRMDSNGHHFHLNYWIDQKGKPRLYTEEQLITCLSLRKLYMLYHDINNILRSIEKVNDQSQIDWLKNQVDKLPFNEYGLFGTLHELHLLAKDVTLLDYELFTTEGYRTRKDSLIKYSEELTIKYEDKIVKNKGNENDLNKLLTIFNK